MLLMSSNFLSAQINFIKADSFQLNSIQIAIFPKEYDDIYLKNRYTLTKEEVEMAEKNLRDCFSNIIPYSGYPKQVIFIVKHYNEFKRQYFGYLDSNGNKIIEINCFRSKHPWILKDWLKKRIIVNDGGSNFWSVKYNTQTHEFFQLVINGSS
jgi:hypothetical protein